jgi:hypothetical protein
MSNQSLTPSLKSVRIEQLLVRLLRFTLGLAVCIVLLDLTFEATEVIRGPVDLRNIWNTITLWPYLSLGILASICSFLSTFIFLLWFYHLHCDLGKLFPDYPVSPSKSLACLLIPLYSLIGFFWISHTMMRRWDCSYDNFFLHLLSWSTKKLEDSSGMHTNTQGSEISSKSQDDERMRLSFMLPLWFYLIWVLGAFYMALMFLGLTSIYLTPSVIIMIWKMLGLQITALEIFSFMFYSMIGLISKMLEPRHAFSYLQGYRYAEYYMEAALNILYLIVLRKTVRTIQEFVNYQARQNIA